MVLNIRLTTDKVPEVFAVFEIVLKDGTVIKTSAVLDKLERVMAYYIHRNVEDLRTYDIKDVIYDGSECEPNQHVDDKNGIVYSFKVNVDDPCRIKKNAKIVVGYEDGSRAEVCGEYAGIPVYVVEYRSCIDLDPDEISSVKLVSMGFKPRD
jgi:hypothetical protein